MLLEISRDVETKYLLIDLIIAVLNNCYKYIILNKSNE